MEEITPIPLQHVVIEDPFWSEKQKMVIETVIPYQWKVMNDEIPGIERSHSIKNYRIAAGDTEGQFYGEVFQDSDLTKWLEAVGYALSLTKNIEIEKMADQAVDIISRAQQSDGYLNTYYTITNREQRWTNVRDDHELYCAGHLIEAAVSYHTATGKTKILEVACKLADHIATVFGPDQGQKRGYPGHPEIELALVKLYQATGNERYLQLAKFFIEERGQQPLYFDIEAEKRSHHRRIRRRNEYFQAHLPVREQYTAEGHAVRAMYLYCGMADIARIFKDQELLQVCKSLWENVIQKRMYITGGVGSSAYQEAFTIDYDLPNDRAYNETCASIGLFFWAHRMLQMEVDRQYSDVMERALYNGIISGISLDGQRYFYVNPLEVWPKRSEHRKDMEKVETSRQPWFGCACCPPNIARLLTSLGQYIYSYSSKERSLFVHLYIGSQTKQKIGNQTLSIKQEADYPRDGKVRLILSVEGDLDCTIAMRIPAWCRTPELTVNDKKINLEPLMEKGYVKIRGIWKNGDYIQLSLPMNVEKVRAHPSVRENIGKIALQRGPLIYCIEEADNGSNLPAVVLDQGTIISEYFDSNLLGGVSVLTFQAKHIKPPVSNELYTFSSLQKNICQVRAIPYYAWANRTPGEMQVWINYISS